MSPIHATCIAFARRGVLIRGASGAGKSDLALRAISSHGARLVADDQVFLVRRGDDIVASAPPSLYGLIEIRGLGIMRMEAESEAVIALVADIADPKTIPRMPERRHCEVLGVELPWLQIAPFEASAVAKLSFALIAAADPALLLP